MDCNKMHFQKPVYTMCMCLFFLWKKSPTSYINRNTNKINGWNGIFVAVVAYVHKNLWIPFLMIRSIQSKYHKRPQNTGSTTSTWKEYFCAIVQIDIQTNGKHCGFLLLLIRCWIFYCRFFWSSRIYVQTQSQKLQNNNFEWRSYWSVFNKNAPVNSNSVCNFVISMQF